jgi:hypothetical protein
VKYFQNKRAFIYSLAFWIPFFLLFGSTSFLTSAYASALRQQPTQVPTENTQASEEPPDQLSIADKVCINCHGKPGTTMTLENGETWDLYVNPTDYAHSIHGREGYACVQCHRKVGEYPHPPFSAEDSRDATLQLNNACEYCHSHQSELNQDGVHANAINNGVREAAVCVDCHGSHTVQQITDPQTNKILPEARLLIPQTCAQCHSLIYDKYRDSVHGSALTDEQNSDVPTCIDCHGVHNISDPTTNEFRLKSPDICAKCHTDATIMNKYGISTDVLNTYVADFHGTTQVLFEQLTPDQQFNKPVCYDCHGVHDIARPDDPTKGLLVRENLLHRCQVCHPDALANFPDAWLSHYIPSPEKYPAVYYVNLFYKIFIPTVLGGMAVLVALDFSRKVRDRVDFKELIPSFLVKSTRIESEDEEPLKVKTETDQEAINPDPVNQEAPIDDVSDDIDQDNVESE